MLSPAIKALAAACFPDLDWLAAEKAAYQYAAEKGLSAVNLEQLFIDEHKSCRCTCCGNSHQITRRRGIYLNGRLVANIVQDAINEHAYAVAMASQ